MIDLFEPPFWIALVAAVIILVPLTTPAARRWLWAGINLGFLALLLPRTQLVIVLLATVTAYLALQLVARPRIGWAVMWLAVTAMAGLFFLHKRPEAEWAGSLTPVATVLTVIGFSYTALRWIDVARAVAEARQPAPDLPSTVNYLLPFHMLAAGPIQSYDEFVAQPAVPPPPTVAQALSASERIAFGLFKKYVIAQSIADLFLTEFRAGGWYFVLEVQLHFLWLYIDFSAYSDIAVGVGRLIGAATPENFNRPYLARNLIEYWERWHISLSLFIRRHIFIPVQLSLMRRSNGQRPMVSACVAYLLAFTLCGLWHDIDYPWLVWGLLQALGLMVVNLYKQALSNRLGRQGMKAYLANRWIHALAVALTFEFAALTLMAARYPYRG